MDKPRMKLQTFLTPEEIFEQAMARDGDKLSAAEIRLLTSGLKALRKVDEKKLNPIELKGVESMVAYIAAIQNASEKTVEAVLLTTFKVQEIRALPSRLYKGIMEFLVDLEMNKVVN
jgi:hypothetical protein